MLRLINSISVDFVFSVFAAKLRSAPNRGSRIAESATFGEFE
jgi:hypothetical protein